MVGAHAHRLQQFDAGDGGGAGAVDDELRVVQRAAGQVAGIDQPGGGDDGGAVLVVVEDGDVHQLAQALLDDEAFRRLDVLEVDAAEGRAEIADAVDELVDVLRVDAQVDAVDVGEAFEQGDLALHHRLAGQRAQIAEAEDGGAVGHDGDHVALAGVVIGEAGIAGDVQAGLGDAGRIGERQVARGGQRFGQPGRQLAGRGGGVHGERLLAGDMGGAWVGAEISQVSPPEAIFVIGGIYGAELAAKPGVTAPAGGGTCRGSVRAVPGRTRLARRTVRMGPGAGRDGRPASPIPPAHASRCS